MLKFLVEHPHRTIERWELLTKAFGYSEQARTRAVDKVVNSLRSKIEPDRRRPRYIVTVHGSGYKWVPRETHEAPSLAPRLDGNTFVGRRTEFEQLSSAIREPGIVTVKGPGGVGKTRLMRRLAHEVASQGEREVVTCGLVQAVTGSDLIQRLAAALEVQGDDEERLGLALAARNDVLIVLDPFEHLVREGPLLERLRHAAPRACLLVASQIALRLRSERVFPLAPLCDDDAVDLLCRRAAEQGTPIEADATVRELVSALDRLPLTLELAAGRLRIFTPSQILDRLGNRMELLQNDGASGAGSASLRATLEWSWHLLSDDDRRVLAAVSVFVGGFTVDQAEAVVCPVVADVPLVPSLERLWSASWLVRRTVDDGLCLDMLDTLRIFVRERAARELPGLASEVEQSHGDAFAKAAVQLRQRLTGRGGTKAWREVWNDNYPVACRRALARGDAFVAVQTGELAVTCLVYRQGAVKAACELVDALNELPDLPPDLQALATFASGTTLLYIDPARARVALAAAASHALTCDDDWLATNALRLVGFCWLCLRQADKARQALDQAAALCRDAVMSGLVRCGLAWLASVEGRIDDAHALLDRAATELWAGEFDYAAAISNVYRGPLLVARGELDAAQRAYQIAFEAYLESEDRLNANRVRGRLGVVSLMREDYASAAETFRRELVANRRMGLLDQVPVSLTNLATAMLSMERLDGVEDLLREAMALAPRAAAPTIEVRSTCQLGRLRLLQGRSVEGLALLRNAAAMPILDHHPSTHLDVVFQLLVGLRAAEARADARTYLSIFEDLRQRAPVSPTRIASVEAIARWVDHADDSPSCNPSRGVEPPEGSED